MNKHWITLQQSWNRLTARERQIATACGLVVGIALFYAGLVQPYLTYDSQLQDNLDEKETRLMTYRRWLETRPALTDKSETDVDSNEDAMSGFLKDVEEMAHQSNVRLVDLKPVVQGEKKSVTLLSVNVEIVAAMPSLARFLYALQTAPGLFEIGRFQILAGETNSPLKVSLLITKQLFTAAASAPRLAR